jgi:hypothetical protein
MPTSFVEEVVRSAGNRLRRFEVNNVLVPLSAVEVLCEGATNLIHLVIHIWEKELQRLVTSLSKLAALRTLHILCQRSDVGMDEILTVVER